MNRDFMTLRQLEIDRRGAVWLKYYELMLGEGGWLSDSPAFDLDENVDGCRHRQINVADGSFRLIDEWRISQLAITGTTILLRFGEPVLSGWYTGTIFQLKHTDFLKRALRARYTWETGDYGLFRGPHSYEPEGSSYYYSNEHFSPISGVFSRFNSEYKFRCDGGEEAVCAVGSGDILGHNTYFVQLLP